MHPPARGPQPLMPRTLQDGQTPVGMEGPADTSRALALGGRELTGTGFSPVAITMDALPDRSRRSGHVGSSRMKRPWSSAVGQARVAAEGRFRLSSAGC